MIEIRKINNSYCAYCSPLAEVSYGSSPEIAENNLRIKLEKYRDSLLERKDRLSDVLKSELKYLQENL